MRVNLTQYRNHIRSIASLILLVAVIVVVFNTTRFALVDDAYISFRYAHNLAYTGELVFNTGEKVEGITNLLWTLILAAEIAIVHLPVERFALFLSLGLIAFSALRLWQLGPLLGSTHLAGTLAAISLVLNPDFIHTTTNGLEAALYTALLVEIIYRYCRNQLKMAFLFAGLLFMTRPEGVVLGFLLTGLVSMEHRSIRETGIGIAILGGVVVLVTLFRMFYYGTPVPNSVIAKSFDISLLLTLRPRQLAISYFESFAVSNPYLVILFVGALVWLLQSHTFNDKSSLALLFCIGGIIFSFIVIIRNGGDWMGHHRLFLQYGILYAVILISLLRQYGIPVSIALALVIWPFIQTTNAIMARNVLSSSINYARRDGFWVETSERLATVLKESDTVSAEALGYLSYHLIHNRFHDPVGLTDAYIARYGRPSVTFGKHDSAYTVGSVSPSVMVWHWAGHLKGVDQKLLDNYETFCATDCDSWAADVVMIRGDRLDDLAPAFADWQKIKIETDWIGIK